ncbi:hypothetical protein [Maledivibacter halophilus]|uniref:Uncharacterized protein n=1 Tax=Maledivibacter halophilus TaxID=36842 RepID=A0A1T5LD32_9FIRM|nr:hypothetical protein [Maledivibacter halophilus]SKC73902.1 hypothetical protein SAMN02194393_02786 [Maledivibacter halophilus]
MRNGKDIIEILIVISVGILLLNLVGDFSAKIKIASERLNVQEYNKYRVVIASLMTLFGALIEWRNIVKIFTKGFCFRFSLFIIAIFLILFPMIPWEIMLSIFKFKAAIYLSAYISTALSILGGILLVRSFRKCE